MRSNHNAAGANFAGLYAELKTHILAHLSAKSLGLIACTNRKINSLGMYVCMHACMYVCMYAYISALVGKIFGTDCMFK